MMMIEAIRIYPVKGLRGLALQDALVEPWGLAGDRRWMVVDATGRFLSQREIPAMAVIEVRLEADGSLMLSAPGHGAVMVSPPGVDAGHVHVTVWRDEVTAREAGAAAEAWLSATLARPARLVYMADPAEARPADPRFAEAADRVSFADGFPLLVTTSASLADLNARLARPVPMDRFRSNIVVGGGQAWMEDDWQAFRVGPVVFRVVKDCDRCVVTTIDQDVGRKSEDNEPLRQLATFRRKAGGRIIFGQNLVPSRLGAIAVGDRVEIMVKP